jgi:hypothetical protein
VSTVATLLVRVGGDLSGLDKAFAGAEQASKGLEKSFSGLGSRLSSLGSDIAKGLGGPLQGLPAVVGNATGALEAGFGKVAGVLEPLKGLFPELAANVGKLGSSFAVLGPVAGIVGGIAAAFVGLAAAAAGVVAGLVALGVNAANTGDALLVMSQQSGVSVEALSRFQYVEQQTDASVEAITGSINKLGINLAKGSKETSAAIGAIGLSLAEIKTLKPEEAFTRIVEGLGRVPDAGQRAKLGMDLFGKGFHDIAQLTQEDLRGLMAEADQFGATISTSLAVAGDRFNDTLGQMSTLLSGLGRAIGAGVLPVLQVFADTFKTELVRAMGTFGISATGLQNTFTTVAVAIGQVLAQIISWVAKAAGAIADFFIDVATRAAPLAKALGKILGADLQIDQFVAQMKTGNARFQEFTADIRQGMARLARDLPARAQAVIAENERLAQSYKDTTGATRTFGEESAKTTDKLKALVSALSGRDAIAAAEEMTAALARMAREGLAVTSEGATRARKVLEDAAEAMISTGKTVPPAMGRLWASLLPPPEVAQQLKGFAELFTKSMKSMSIPVPLIAGNLQKDLDAVFKDLKWEEFPKQAEGAFKAAKWGAILADWSAGLIETVNHTVAEMLVGLQSFSDGFESIFRSIQQLGASIINDLLTDVTKGMASSIKKALTTAEGKGVAQGALTGAVVGGAVGYGFGKQFGKTAGALAGAASGALTGAIAGSVVPGIGTAIGAVVGGAAGLLGGLFGGGAKKKEEQAKIAQTRAEIEKTLGGLENVKKAADRLGVSFKDLWDTKKPKVFQAAVDKLNKGLEKEKAILEGLTRSLDEVAASGALVTKELAEEIKIGVKIPGGEAAVFGFLQKQADAATKGIEAFLSNTTVKTQQGAAAISGTIAALFDELQRQGLAPTEAFARLQPAITTLTTQMQQAGLVGAAAFTPLAELATLAADAIAGPMFDAMAGLEQGLTATFNLGLLNQEAFAGFAAELLAGYQALEVQGKGGVTAMAGMRGALQKVWELAEDFGYTLTEDEQALVDFAEASGLIGEQFKPAADRMVSAIEALVDRLDQFLTKLGDVGTQAGEAGGALEDAFAGIKVPPIAIPYEFKPLNELPSAAGVPLEVPVPALAAGGIVRRPTLALVGERGPEAVVPLSGDFTTGEQTTAIYLDGELLARNTTKRQPRILRAYGAVR